MTKQQQQQKHNKKNRTEKKMESAFLVQICFSQFQEVIRQYRGPIQEGRALTLCWMSTISSTRIGPSMVTRTDKHPEPDRSFWRDTIMCKGTAPVLVASTSLPWLQRCSGPGPSTARAPVGTAGNYGYRLVLLWAQQEITGID